MGYFYERTLIGTSVLTEVCLRCTGPMPRCVPSGCIN